MIYYFILGRENKISQKELECVLAGFDFGLTDDSVSILTDQILEIKLDQDSKKVAELIKILGGTVKIYQKIASADEKLADLLAKENFSKKMIFAVSNYSKVKIDTFKLAISAKKSVGKSIRVVDGKEDDRLSSAQSFQYKMDIENTEYGLFETGIGKLIAVQDINDWSRRDYGKPRSDAVSGMLPPKLARMMVNLAVGQTRIMNKPDNFELISHDSCLVVDPFCGSGNILIEALSLGCDLIGSDLSERAVLDTKVNLGWFINESGIINQKLSTKPDDSVFVADATKFDFSKIDRDFIIVSEPFLGQPRKAKLRIEEEIQAKKKITKLYLDFLKNLLTAGDRLRAVGLVFPLFELANGKKLSIFNESVDFIKEIGYAILCPPMEYGRDYQVVKRQIVLLEQK